MINGIKTAAASLVLALGLMLGGVERAEAIEKCDVMAAIQAIGTDYNQKFTDLDAQLTERLTDLDRKRAGPKAELEELTKSRRDIAIKLEAANNKLTNWTQGKGKFSTDDMKAVVEEISDLKNQLSTFDSSNAKRVNELEFIIIAQRQARNELFTLRDAMLSHSWSAVSTYVDVVRNYHDLAEPRRLLGLCEDSLNHALQIGQKALGATRRYQGAYGDAELALAKLPKLPQVNLEPRRSWWSRMFVTSIDRKTTAEAADSFKKSFNPASNRVAGVAVAAFTAFGIFNDWFVTPAQAGEALLDMPAPPSIPGSDGGGSGDAGGSTSDLDLGEAYGCLCQQPEPPLAPATPTPLSPVARGTATPEPKGK